MVWTLHTYKHTMKRCCGDCVTLTARGLYKIYRWVRASAYTMYRHLQLYCSHPSICEQCVGKMGLNAPL